MPCKPALGRQLTTAARNPRASAASAACRSAPERLQRRRAGPPPISSSRRFDGTRWRWAAPLPLQAAARLVLHHCTIAL